MKRTAKERRLDRELLEAHDAYRAISKEEQMMKDMDRAQAREEREKHNSRIRGVIKGLLRIAQTAMPDTYYATDSRVKNAKKLLEELK